MKVTSLLVWAGVCFVFPLFVFAAGLVPCDGAIADSEQANAVCEVCHLVTLTDNVIRWLVGFLTVMGAVLLAVAGFKMVTAGGNPGAVSAAREMFTNVVIGFIIMLSAWLVVDTIMKMFVQPTIEVDGRTIQLGMWNKIECQGEFIPPPTSTTTPATTTPECSDDAALMAKYRGSPVGVEAPGLRTMINCYLADPAIAAAVDNAQIYTVDRSHPRCSLTNGFKVCGNCSHSANSCHYGRGSGKGAMSVDFNARSGYTEMQLFNLLQTKKVSCGGSLLFETNHTHISMSSCGGS